MSEGPTEKELQPFDVVEERRFTAREWAAFASTLLLSAMREKAIEALTMLDEEETRETHASVGHIVSLIDDATKSLQPHLATEQETT